MVDMIKDNFLDFFRLNLAIQIGKRTSLLVVNCSLFEIIKGELTCFLNSSACGANAVGSASLTNCITSSMDQEEGFLLGGRRLSRSDATASGPVVELAASKAEQTH